MDGGYSQGGAPPPHIMGYFPAVPNYNMSQGPLPASSPSSNSRSSNTISIWAGDLDAYMDEAFLRQAVAASGWGNEITRIKVVRDHYSGVHAGYGFLDAASPEAAQRVIATGSGMPIPGTSRCWRLNLGRNATISNAAGSESNIYVGNLEPSVTDYQLMTAFRPRYASVRHAKVVCNEYGQSRGFGFVRFANHQEAERAVSEMQGFVFNSKPIRLSPASGRTRNSAPPGHTPRGPHSQFHHGPPPHGPPTNKRPRQLMSPDDPNNTTIFIGGTANHISEDLLRREFSTYGELEAVRVPPNKTGFAFVRFKSRECAQRAKDEISGTHMVSLNPSKPVRIEWASEQIPITKSAPNHTNASVMYPASSQPLHYSSQYPNISGAHGPPVPVPAPPYHANHAGAAPNASGNDTRGHAKQESVIRSSQGGPETVPVVGQTDPSLSSAEAGPGNADGQESSGRTAVKSTPTSNNVSSETEPPSKRVAVGRAEYTPSSTDTPSGSLGNSTTVKNESVETAKESGADDSPAMQFSWLKASSSQPAANTQ